LIGRRIMAKSEDEIYRVSGKQFVEDRAARNIVTMTPSLDTGLSGGIPQGCTVVIGGKPGLGKTSLSLQYAANAQNAFGSKVFFFPIEGRLTQQIFGQIRGIKLDEKSFEVVLPPPIRNKEGKVLGHKKWNAQEWWTEIGKTVQANPGSVIIVDSIASLSSDKEISEGMGYQGRGDLQKAESQFCRIYGNLIVPSEWLWATPTKQGG
jgi:predicted ATP-dependent serine protease